MANIKCNERYPDVAVRNALQGNNDNRLIGLWSLIGKFIVYDVKKSEEHDSPNIEVCNEMFCKDPIAYDLLLAIIKMHAKFMDRDIIVKQVYCGHGVQRLSDLKGIIQSNRNPRLIAHADSNFMVLIADNTVCVKVNIKLIKKYKVKLIKKFNVVFPENVIDVITFSGIIFLFSTFNFCQFIF